MKMRNNHDLSNRKSIGLQKFLALGTLVILYTFFSIFGKNFFSVPTLINILDSSYYIGFMAVGITFVIITGGIDLSIGAVMMCSALIGGVAYNIWHWPIAISLVLIIVIAVIFGLINGILVAKLKLPPFIATLGTQMISLGFGAIVSKVMTMRFPTVTDPDGWYKFVFYKTQRGFPIGAIWLIVFLIIGFILLNKTRLGRYTYAIGSNEEATRLSGVKTDFWKMMVYTLSGFSAGLAAIVYLSAYTSIIPSTGSGIEMLPITGVVIGGTSMAGGVGTITGTIIGVFVMSVLKQGLMSMNLQAQWQTFFIGIVVIGAVLLDNYRSKKVNEIKKD